MEDIVVKGIAVGDVFQGHTGDEGDDIGILGLENAVHPLIVVAQLVDELVDDKLRGIKHGPTSTPVLCPAGRLVTRETPERHSRLRRRPILRGFSKYCGRPCYG